MAGTLLHVTLAARAVGAMEERRGRDAALRFPHDLALGAVLFDLPYFDRLARTGLALARRRPLRHHPFGGALHRRSPAGLLLALLDGARADAGRALALGALTHHAVDLVFHPEIERRLDAAGEPRGERDGAHKRLEDEIDLHCHYDLLGGPGIGTPYARRALRIEPAPGWAGHVAGAIARAHGESPAAAALERWRAQLALFGLASSFPGAPWAKTLPEDDPELLERSVALAEEAIRASARYADAGARYLAGDLDREGFLGIVPDLCSLDGGPAEPGASPIGVDPASDAVLVSE